MRTRLSRREIAVVGLFAALCAESAAAPSDSSDDPEILPRSVYVPVRFEVAPCLREVVIRTEDGEVRAAAPGRIVSQFTFFDRREGAAPPWERLRIEGWIEQPGENGREPFRAGIIITPASIYLGRKRLDLGIEDRVGRFRRTTDLRLPERALRLQPGRECAGVPTGPAADAGRRPPLPARR